MQGGTINGKVTIQFRLLQILLDLLRAEGRSNQSPCCCGPGEQVILNQCPTQKQATCLNQPEEARLNQPEEAHR